MDNIEKILIECELFKVISAFHDCDDKEKRNAYVKEYIIQYCKENNLDVMTTIDFLKELFDKKRKSNSNFQYEYYKGNALEKIVFGNNKKSNSKNNNSKKDKIEEEIK